MELFSGAHENVTLYKMILPFVVSTEVRSDRLLPLPPNLHGKSHSYIVQNPEINLLTL